MIRLIYGTTNEAKLKVMRDCAAGLPLEIVGLHELERTPEVSFDEAGSNPLENAVIKARAYYGALREPVFSCDSGLYFEGLPEALQPGVHVRRVRGRLLNDEEMIAYYGGLARQYGGLRAQYRNAICLVTGEGEEICSMDEALFSEPFGIVEKPYADYLKGFPLDALSVRLPDGTPYTELDDECGKRLYAMEGFRRFFESWLKKRG